MAEVPLVSAVAEVAAADSGHRTAAAAEVAMAAAVAGPAGMLTGDAVAAPVVKAAVDDAVLDPAAAAVCPGLCICGRG